MKIRGRVIHISHLHNQGVYSIQTSAHSSPTSQPIQLQHKHTPASLMDWLATQTQFTQFTVWITRLANILAKLILLWNALRVLLLFFTLPCLGVILRHTRAPTVALLKAPLNQRQGAWVHFDPEVSLRLQASLLRLWLMCADACALRERIGTTGLCTTERMRKSSH